MLRCAQHDTEKRSASTCHAEPFGFAQDKLRGAESKHLAWSGRVTSECKHRSVQGPILGSGRLEDAFDQLHCLHRNLQPRQLSAPLAAWRSHLCSHPTQRHVRAKSPFLRLPTSSAHHFFNIPLQRTQPSFRIRHASPNNLWSAAIGKAAAFLYSRDKLLVLRGNRRQSFPQRRDLRVLSRAGESAASNGDSPAAPNSHPASATTVALHHSASPMPLAL